MKLKQKEYSRKNVHMPIEPVKEGRSHDDKLTTQKISSPDALLSQNLQQFKQDQILEINEQKNDAQHSVSDDSHQQSQVIILEQNAQNSKNTIQRQEEVRDKIQLSYLQDHNQQILRPIARHLVFYSILLVLLYVFLKIFELYETIQARRINEEVYLKNLMNQRMTDVQKQNEHAFSFLDQVRQIYIYQISNSAFTSKQPQCQGYQHKYLCSNASTFNSTFSKLIDMNYDVIQLGIAMLLQHINTRNVFIINLENEGHLEFNLTKIIDQDLKNEHQTYQTNKNKALNFDEVYLLKNYIKNFTEPASTDTTSSYLDRYTKGKQHYQIFQVYIFDQNQTNLSLSNSRSFFNVYCLLFYMQYSPSNTKAKVCAAIQADNKLENSENIMLIKTQFPKLTIQNATLLNVTYTKKYVQSFYDQFKVFVQNNVQKNYPEYHLNQLEILSCIRFHDAFYQMFADNYLELQVFRCYYNSYLHFLIGKYIFAWSNLKINKVSYLDAPTILQKQLKFGIQTFIASNISYFRDIHNIASNGSSMIQTTIKNYGGLMFIILLSFEMSKKIVKSHIIDSLFVLKKISKLARGPPQDAKRNENQFLKIQNQLKDQNKVSKTRILGVLIGYLRKFLWIKKLSYYNKKFTHHKFKRSRLLLEGLKLFKYVNDEQYNQKQSAKNSSNCLPNRQTVQHPSSKVQQKNLNSLQKMDSTFENDQVTIMNYKRYPTVLIYIYQELIYLKLDTIQNFQNVKVLSRKRQSSKRKSNEMHILHEIENDPHDDSKFRFEKEQNDYNFQDTSIYPQQVPQISMIDPPQRQNRGVRFSNQIQLKGFNQQKKSKFRQHILSNSSIGKKSSLKSLKSIESQVKRKLDESERISKSQEDSAIASSTKKLRRQTTIKNILRGDQSVHEGLKTMKFDDSDLHERSHLHKYQMADSSVQENQPQFSIDQFYYTHRQIFQQTVQAYWQIIQYYEQLIQIKQRNLDNMVMNKMISIEEQEQMVNEIYSIEIRRLKICEKYLKTILEQNKDQQIDFQQRGINLNFDHLTFYQTNYQIDQDLIDKSTIYKMKIWIYLGKTISYKKLQQICKTQNPQTSLQANFLYAQELAKLQPFLDFQVINLCYYCLTSFDTSILFKRKCLELIIKTLAKSKHVFVVDIEELDLIKRYYNRKHKKFYFIADMTESYDIFTPILTKIYELMGRMDLMQIYNLGMNENLQDMELVRQIIKPQTCQAFISLFEQLTLENEKEKQKNSSKMIHKRVVYEKDFNEILDEIQKDQTQFSSFLIIILGGDQLPNHSSILTDDVDSSNNQRQLNQLLYSQINRKIEKNYYHIIEVGTYLNNYLTKQGKLKKHIKNSSDLLEIDLIKKNLTEHFSELQKFING